MTDPTISLIELKAAAQAVIDRWDSPSWKDLPATADYINRLRKAIREAEQVQHEFNKGSELNLSTGGVQTKPNVVSPSLSHQTLNAGMRDAAASDGRMGCNSPPSRLQKH